MNFLSIFVLLCLFPVGNAGMLKPKESESRSIQEMNGMWNFRADRSASRSQGMDSKWWERPLREVCLDIIMGTRGVTINIVRCRNIARFSQLIILSIILFQCNIKAYKIYLQN